MSSSAKRRANKRKREWLSGSVDHLRYLEQRGLLPGEAQRRVFPSKLGRLLEEADPDHRATPPKSGKKGVIWE